MDRDRCVGARGFAPGRRTLQGVGHPVAQARCRDFGSLARELGNRGEQVDVLTVLVGNFPVDWSELNGRFRDSIRKFGKGDGGQLNELGRRLTGSADLYGDDGRSAYNSVNFVTCHDGFTLHDLVSYNRKHNDANLEGNRDGADANKSWNCGIEGETAPQNLVVKLVVDSKELGEAVLKDFTRRIKIGDPSRTGRLR